MKSYSRGHQLSIEAPSGTLARLGRFLKNHRRGASRSVGIYAAVIAMMLAAMSASAQLAYEHFDYPDNTQIDGQGIRSNGWNGPWSGSGDMVVSPGLQVSCNGLAPVGNALGPTSGDASVRTMLTPVHGKAGTSLLLSAVINSDVNGGTFTQATIGNSAGGGQTFIIGELPETDQRAANWALQNSAGVYYSNQPVVANTPTCLVARIDFAVSNGLDRMRLWVNPPTVLSNTTPADIDVTTAHVELFNGVFWQTQQGQTLDEVAIAGVGGTWTPVAQPFGGKRPGQALLLTDGTVLVQDIVSPTDWFSLAPDQYGSYANGSWRQLASIPQNFGYEPSVGSYAVLVDGRVIVEGGEYNTSNFTSNCHDPNANPPLDNCGAIFDPIANSWTQVAPPDFGDVCGSNGTTWCDIGSGEGVVLPDGSFMLAQASYVAHHCCGDISKLEALLKPPYTGPWIQTGFNKQEGNSEEGRTLLPDYRDGNGGFLSFVMMVDTYNPHNHDQVCGSYQSSEVYVRGNVFGQQAGYWYCLGDTPEQLYPPGDNEMGPAILRPDGSVFQAGADSHTAILTPNLYWTAGPDFPLDRKGNQLAIEDGPAALLPNGNVLMLASKDQGSAPATFLELTPAPQNTLVEVPAAPNADRYSSAAGQMLLLPTAQLLFIEHVGLSSTLQIYTPQNPRVDPAWRPKVTAVNGVSCNPFNPFCTFVVHTTSVNTVSGLGFNGMSQGAAFGDEYQSATNYPLVRLSRQRLCISQNGCSYQPNVYYCRTHDHSYMGVATGNLPVSTQFDCPGVPSGRYEFEVVTNGISSGTLFGAVVQP